ncbi:uncharacterized protein LOC17880365 isoform X2 [Capsella rubella]|uniref:uncharacterized protein LOC17880365 isoform X2 n=1 Tax=Capsella rubella TaxID=81985 RepID=UPI000CD534B5|nr:uncharacterized protein LOC17880365 isoform X2 [Capsella rubella]
MANREDTSPEIHCVFIETSLDTGLALPVHKDEIISDFKDKLRYEHKRAFPEIGEINVSALKVKRRRKFYHFAESMNVYKAFDGVGRNWFIYVDAVRVEKSEVLAIMDADEHRSNLEMVEKKKEIAIVDGMHTKDLILEEGLETEVVESKTRKRKIRSSDGKTSRKKSKVDLSQSVVDTTELCGKLQVEVASKSCVVSPREKIDDILMGTDIESGERNGVSMGENPQTSDADRVLEEKNPTVNSELVDGHTMGEGKDVPDNQTDKEALEKIDDLTGITEQDLEKGGKTADIVMIDQEKDLPPPSELVDGQNTSQDDERGEGSRLTPNPQTAELVTNTENQLEASSGLTTGPATEKKRKRTKSSKDQINQSTAAATTVSRKIVNEITEVPGNADCVDATSKSCPISESEIIANPLIEAVQKEIEMGGKSVEDVGRDDIQTDDQATHPESHLEANSGLATGPVLEKKKKRKKSSKDHNNEPAAAAATTTATETTASREIVNVINGLPGHVACVDATSESHLILRSGNLGKENEMGEKINEDVGSGKVVPSSVDNIQTDNLVSNPESQLEVSSGLATSLATEKKKKQKKSSSKDHNNKSTAATAASKKIVNEQEKVSVSIHQVDATSESIPDSTGEKLASTLVDAIQNENEMGDKFIDKVGSREATPINADKIQDANNLQVASLASTPTALVHESKTLNRIGKFTNENASCEHAVSQEKVEIDAGQVKSVKSSKKKSSKKVKTLAKEDTLVDSAAQNIEPVKIVDGEGPDVVIRNVLDSLQQRNEGEENLDKSGKKSSKKLKKKDSLNIVVEAQVVDSLQQKNEAAENPEKSGKKSSKRSKKKDSLNIAEEAQVWSVEVNNSAHDEVSPINNPKDTDASFTPAKKNTESNASHLNKIIEVAVNTEDINHSIQTQKQNADMGDNFGSSQKDNIVGGGNKQDKVAGGAKSKKEKKSLDLHPGGSIDGAMKPKERKGRIQPSSSVTSQLQSRDKNDHSGSKIDHSDAPLKGTVNNKKEATKKLSNPTTAKKSKMNVNNKKEAVKKSSTSVTANKSKLNFFKDAEKWNASEDESKTTSHDSTKTPSNSSSDNDSDVTSSMYYRKQENNLVGGTNTFSGSLQDILRSSKSYKVAKLTASQSQPDEFVPDIVPDSQAY